MGGFQSESEQEPSALGLWFDSVRDVPIEEFENGDLCRAVRQDICTSELLPIAVRILADNLRKVLSDA
ncbi:contact-dependent growth inhibition system immunity protein [Pseudomonas gingeri]